MPVRRSLGNLVRAEKARWNSLAIFLFILVASVIAADFIILQLRPRMLPENAPPARPQPTAAPMASTNYSDVVAKNVFSRTGEMPPALGRTETGETMDMDPVPSQLPLTLVGTIVHVNEDRSIATVQFGSQNTILPVIKGDAMEGMATAVKVERGRLIFRNTNNNRLEYIELPQEEGVSLGRRATSPAVTGSTEISQVRDNEFRVDQKFVQKSLGNLQELLQDARLTANIRPGGGIDGFRFVDIKPGSIYEKLGLQRGDVLKSANGQPIDSPAKGVELYQTLRNSNRIELSVERNGRVEDFVYNID